MIGFRARPRRVRARDRSGLEGGGMPGSGPAPFAKFPGAAHATGHVPALAPGKCHRGHAMAQEGSPPPLLTTRSAGGPSSMVSGQTSDREGGPLAEGGLANRPKSATSAHVWAREHDARRLVCRFPRRRGSSRTTFLTGRRKPREPIAGEEIGDPPESSAACGLRRSSASPVALRTAMEARRLSDRCLIRRTGHAEGQRPIRLRSGSGIAMRMHAHDGLRTTLGAAALAGWH